MAILRPKAKPLNKKDIFVKAFHKTWIEFTKLTSIQGLRYTTDPDTNKFFRIIWFIIVIIMFGCAVAMVLSFYNDFMSNPTRMNIETDHAPLPDMKFPAITICSSNYISYIKSKEFVKNLKLPANISQDTVMSYIYQTIGFRMKVSYQEKDLQQLQDILTINRYTITDFMSSLRINCNEMFIRCRWQMDIINCTKLFQKSRTYFGICCSFNIKQIGIDFQNEYATVAGINGGLSIIISSPIDNTSFTTYNGNGFKLIVHQNQVFPSEADVINLISLNSEYFIRILPEEISCSQQVKQLSYSDRRCLFPEENSLLYFPEYDENNCEVECEIKSTIRTCNCTPYYFLPITNKQICNFTKIPCLIKNFDINVIQKGANNFKCICAQNCQDINYDVQLNRLQLMKIDTILDPFYQNISEVGNKTVMHIFMATQTYRRMRRDLLSNMIQLVSNFGAAFSLFLGVSIMSVIELIYFFTAVLRRYYIEQMETHERVSAFLNDLEKPKIKKWYYSGLIENEFSNKNKIINVKSIVDYEMSTKFNH